ncbi:hypothetical protein [Lysinibacillus sp. NPDC086135]|uniref:hypothetical protein n=1 Tax=Lysinibacillus sp. NPDC086135 TaxID=3364130 RepID=UPI00382FF54A
MTRTAKVVDRTDKMTDRTAKIVDRTDKMTDRTVKIVDRTDKATELRYRSAVAQKTFAGISTKPIRDAILPRQY